MSSTIVASPSDQTMDDLEKVSKSKKGDEKDDAAKKEEKKEEPKKDDEATPTTAAPPPATSATAAPPTPDDKGDKPVYITVEPLILEFEARKDGQKFLKLKNTHTKKVMFKLKTSDNRKYWLSQVFGEIDVDQTVEVTVTHVKGAPKEVKMLIVHSEATGEKDLGKAFKTTNITCKDVIVKLTDINVKLAEPRNRSMDMAMIEILELVGERFDWKDGDNFYDKATSFCTEMSQFIKSIPDYKNQRCSAKLAHDVREMVKSKKEDEKDDAAPAEKKEEKKKDDKATPTAVAPPTPDGIIEDDKKEESKKDDKATPSSAAQAPPAPRNDEMPQMKQESKC